MRLEDRESIFLTNPAGAPLESHAEILVAPRRIGPDVDFPPSRLLLAVSRIGWGDIQQGKCFYCGRGIAGPTAHVDHFIAWSRYPTDLAHNFVLADNGCNTKKRDRLPAYEHLAAWT